MRGSKRRSRDRAKGQALVVMVVAMIPALLMVALIVDGGNAWAMQRITQNGADAAADSGATVLGERLRENPPALGHDSAYWDVHVSIAVSASASANRIGVPDAYYTDICGVPLRPDGTRAASLAEAARVGAGFLPAGSGPAPSSCPAAGGTVGPVAGVLAFGEHTFGTYFAQIAGIETFTARTQATAIAGYLQSGPMLPITFFINITYCDQQGDGTYGQTNFTKYVTIVLPICKHGPGNVGWIDWNPPNGGTPELIACTEHPCNPDITVPKWLQIAQTGGTSSKPLEDAINVHAGTVVLIPMFEGTCSTWFDTMTTEVENAATNFGCQSGYGDIHGNSTWYRIRQVGAFMLQQAYTNGNNKDECNPPWSNPPDENAKTTNCFIGQWVDFIDSGTVGAGPGAFSNQGVVGVQLIH